MKDHGNSHNHLRLVKEAPDTGWIQQAVSNDEVWAWFNQNVTVADGAVAVNNEDYEGLLELLRTKFGVSESEADQIFYELVKLKRAGQ